MPNRLLHETAALPVWRRPGIRALEARLQHSSALALMDLAGLAVARLALAVAPHARTIGVLAGPGNNGGDGLEAALQLHQRGQHVQVWLLAEPGRLPSDARRAFDRASAAGVRIHLGLPTSLPLLGPQDLWIDAMLGIGASRGLPAEWLNTVQWLNASAAPVLAIDIPSGLDADSGQPLGRLPETVQANHTLTLLGVKPGLFMGHGRDVCGTLWLDDLGLSGDAPAWCAPDAWLNPPHVRPPLRHASHKGTHGDVAVVGGECLNRHSAMSGAGVLAAQSALHGGAGRVMLCLLGNEVPALPADLMRRDLAGLDLPQLTVVAGCGGGQAIAGVLGPLLQQSAQLVLDADALNRVAEDPWLQQQLRQRSARRQATVMTPHPLEAARLLGTDTGQVQSDRLSAARQMAESFACCVVLKGSGSVIAAPGQTARINPTGNGRLATAGTGDVLAGLIGARLAGLRDAWAAACDAVWTHGQAADDWPLQQALSASRLADTLR